MANSTDLGYSAGQAAAQAATGGGIEDLIKDIGGTLLAGGQYFIGKNNIEDQKDITTGALTNSASVLNKGYDEALAQSETGIDELMKLLTAGLTEQKDAYRRAAYDYSSANTQSVNDYERDIKPILEQFIRGLSGASDLYGLSLDQIEKKAGDALQGGADDYERQLAPYTAAGTDALGQIQRIAAQDPNALTPSQRIAFNDTNRDAMATLAASGLRGAGRAGVAAVADAMARARARFRDENQQRSDQALMKLNEQGFNANTNVADVLNNLKKSIADIRYKTGTTKANNSFDTNSAIAKAAYGVGSGVADKRLAATNQNNQTIFNTDKGIGDLTGNYYGGLENLTGDRYQNRAQTTLDKARVDSTTGLGIANANKTATDQNAQNNASALDKIGTKIIETISKNAKGWL